MTEADTAPTAPLSPIDPGGWAAYLDEDEILLWEGRPNTGLRFRATDAFMTIFGLVFGSIAILRMVTAPGAGEMGGFDYEFILLGLPFLAVGAYLAVGRFFFDSHARSRTSYALTNRRAIIARAVWGRSLRSWPIGPMTEIEYQPGEEASIYFAKNVHRDSSNRTSEEKHGFEYISDGDEIYRLMRLVKERRA